MMHWMVGLKHNWGMKLFCLFCAIGMWVFVMKDQNPVIEMTYTVPVQVQNLDQNYLVEGVPSEVRVHLRGPRNAIFDINPSVLKAYVNMKNARVGQENVAINFTAPTGTFIDSITPENVTVTVDEYMVKELQVQAQPLGTVPNDIAIKDSKVMPTTVTISGPAHLVSRASYAVIRINLDKHRESFTEVGDILPVDSAGNVVEGLTITPKGAQIQYELERIRMEKKVPVQANVVGNVPVGYTVKRVVVEPKELTIVGKESILNGIDGVKTIDIPVNGATGSFTGNYSFVLPEGVTTSTDRVVVKVEIEPHM
ncbi:MULTISPECIES: YbbR-like domain-containing protein [unclassified Veillonella]|uniref:CdaR family protein n=1 Tax=unclassified Veillonella TaxID=2630086 RepID=UPI000F8D2992|nr:MULTISPECIES: CdaR family protein [unclassified Veillonella]